MSRSINPFLRAHGAKAGPTMRPAFTGFVAGELAAISIFAAQWLLNWHLFFTKVFGWPLVIFGLVIYGALSGIGYGRVYRRAANDVRGGWIFGASTGFILWMVDPVIWFPFFGYPPLFVGRPALLFMLIHVAHGTLLGLLYPWVHFLSARQIRLEQGFGT